MHLPFSHGQWPAEENQSIRRSLVVGVDKQNEARTRKRSMGKSVTTYDTHTHTYRVK